MNRLLLALLLAAASAAWAQPAAPAPRPATPAPAQPAAQDAKVHINLTGVTLHAVVVYLSDLTGKPVLLPDRFPGDRKLNIASGARSTVTRDKAYEIFTVALREMGYAVIETDAFLQIVPDREARGLPVTEAAAGQARTEQERLVTTLVRIRYADASKLAPILTGLRSKAGAVQAHPDTNQIIITDYVSHRNTMLDLVAKLDVRWSENTCVIHPLKRRAVRAVMPAVTAYVQNLMKNAEALERKRLEALSIHAFDANNALVLFGHPEDLERIKKLVASLDIEVEKPQRMYHTYNAVNQDAAELAKVLMSVLDASAKGKPRDDAQAPAAIVDKANNAVILVATPDQYAEVLPLIQDLDRPKSQVLIEAALVEMSMDRFLDLGIEMGTADRGDGKVIFGSTHHGLTTLEGGSRVPTTPTAGGVSVGLLKNSNVVAILRMAAKDEDIGFIAAPRIMASDNRQATVDISEQREYQKSIVTPEGRTSEVTHGGFLSASISLNITPHINDNGTIRLEIKQMTEQFLPSSAAGSASLANKTSRKAETEVIVPDGATVVIAGLTATTDVKRVNKVPWLGDIPYLGLLFRRTETTRQQRNLCVFITPHVMATRETLAREADIRREGFRRAVQEGKGARLPADTLEAVTGGGNAPLPQKERADRGG